MKLTVLERLLVLRILPKKGDLTTLRIVRDLERDLSFSEEEHVALQFKNTGKGGVRWVESADPMKDVELGPKANEIIVDMLVSLERSGTEFPIAMMDICDKVGYEGLPLPEPEDEDDGSDT